MEHKYEKGTRVYIRPDWERHQVGPICSPPSRYPEDKVYILEPKGFHEGLPIYRIVGENWTWVEEWVIPVKTIVIGGE